MSASEKHLVIVVYDISHDRRRTRLHHALADFGTPVQYSVFECLLSSQSLAQMRRRIRRIIHPRQDHVRLYHLCAGCRRKTEVTAGPPPAEEEACIIV